MKSVLLDVELQPEALQLKSKCTTMGLNVGICVACALGLAAAIFGEGGFSTTDDKLGLAIERFGMVAIFTGPIFLLFGWIVGESIGQVKAEALQAELDSALQHSELLAPDAVDQIPPTTD